MLIGELSQRTGVHAHRLRYYEAKGLLEPCRSTSGYREYSDDAIPAVTQILKLLQAGLSTRDIRAILPCATGTTPDLEPCPEVLDTLLARLHRLDKQIDVLVRYRQNLHASIDSAKQQMRS